MEEKILRAIDFFCGGGGMTNGLKQAGINVIAGVDLDSEAKETYEINNSPAKFVNEDITKLPLEYFEKEFNVQRNDDEMIFVGCSPCQFYSIIRSSKEKSRKTKDLLLYFEKFVEYYKPGYVLVENVPGIMKNKESVLDVFLSKLTELGYGSINDGHCVYSIVNMKDYGIPQNRQRFSLVATRLNKQVHLPEPENHVSTVREAIGNICVFPKISAGDRDDDKIRFHSAKKLSDLNICRLENTPEDGGTRLAYKDNKELIQKCYIGHDKSFTDVYGRLYWDKPSPTITTKFLSISNGRFGHPEQNRGLSIREGATLQTFPMNYEFKTNSLLVAARLIGNAVPPKFARKIGEMLNG
ncbi:MAG: DNA cytosine methyltransferase [Treponema sp.]|uniref:DNA cytosine methyltransferase n=1 Tax=Treponema sp. TaxID=166 RepID=UPI0025CD848D|nr:DNA cytosine methyltransferase [Treponema sp.]MBQ8678815.1 DNA cytosine methyltransferase [Treponema sp.]